MTPIDIQVSRSKVSVEGQAYSLYVGEGGISVLQTAIFHTIVVHDPRVCHDLDQKSYLQGKGHGAHIPKIRVRVITPDCQIGSG